MRAVNEKTLIKKCLRGEREAFDELIRMYYDYVYGFLLKASTDRSLAEDLTQETFLRMIRSIERFDIGGSASFGTWLITIAKNLYIDHLRRNRVVLEELDGTPLSDSSDAESEALRRLDYEELLRAIEMLPPEQGIAIRLKYEENLTLEQIGRRFGVPPKTIKSRIHDGTVKLRRKLKIREGTEDI